MSSQQPGKSNFLKFEFPAIKWVQIVCKQKSKKHKFLSQDQEKGEQNKICYPSDLDPLSNKKSASIFSTENLISLIETKADLFSCVCLSLDDYEKRARKFMGEIVHQEA